MHLEESLDDNYSSSRSFPERAASPAITRARGLDVRTASPPVSFQPPVLALISVIPPRTPVLLCVYYCYR